MNRKTYNVKAYPELALICLIVIATKLNHPFDSIIRIPESDSDPTTTKIDWSEWREIMSEKGSVGLKRGEEIKATDVDVSSMNAKKMDDYLDWYQKTWLDDRDPKSMHQRNLT
jgi:RNA polymerase I-specific transcription initiation factor RRN7